jgi:hypothetical protein
MKKKIPLPFSAPADFMLETSPWSPRARASYEPATTHDGVRRIFLADVIQSTYPGANAAVVSGRLDVASFAGLRPQKCAMERLLTIAGDAPRFAGAGACRPMCFPGLKPGQCIGTYTVCIEPVRSSNPRYGGGVWVALTTDVGDGAGIARAAADSNAAASTDADSNAAASTDADSNAAASTDADSNAAASTDADSNAAASTDAGAVLPTPAIVSAAVLTRRAPVVTLHVGATGAPPCASELVPEARASAMGNIQLQANPVSSNFDIVVMGGYFTVCDPECVTLPSMGSYIIGHVPMFD